MPIGVFDSGLGGLTVLAALRRRLPVQDFVYLSDAANAPYGVRAPGEIFDLTCRAVERLFARDCRLVILACNTASAVALRRMQESWLPHAAPERRVLGVFVPVIEAVTGRPWAFAGPPAPCPVARLGLFATPATVRSGAFTRELSMRATGVAVTEVACPGLVDAIEAGDRAAADALAAGFAAELLARCPDPEAAVLGCTHYPLVASAFARALPPGVRIFSQPEIVAESLADYLTRHPHFVGGEGRLQVLTTGNPARARQGAEIFLDAPPEFEPA